MWIILLLIIIFVILLLFRFLFLRNKRNSLHYTLLSPGALVGVWRGNKPILKEARGISNIFTQEPIRLQDRMRIGSVTKTMTATVIYQLVGEDKLKLTDQAQLYIPSVPAGITIEQLGRMNSGLFNYSDDTTFQRNVFITDPYREYTPQELLEIAAIHPSMFPPGQGWYYSNTNYIILGLIIEQITGNSLADEFQRRIFQPLGMIHSYLPDNNDILEPHAEGYAYGFAGEDDELRPLIRVTNYNPSWGWAAGGIISTLDDLGKYAKALATGQLIPKNLHQHRTQLNLISSEESPLTTAIDNYTDTGDIKYGFGIGEINGYIGHNGGIPGYQTFLGYIPKSDISVVVLANLQETKDGKLPADSIAIELRSQF